MIKDIDKQWEIEKPLSRKDLVDYIVKLNDRELAKRQASGLTIWALIGALGIIGYQILDFVSQVKWDTGYILLLSFTILYNFSYICYWVRRFAFSNNLDYIENYTSKQKKFYEFALLCILIPIGTYLNFESYLLSQEKYFHYYWCQIFFWIFSVHFFIILIEMIYNHLYNKHHKLNLISVNLSTNKLQKFMIAVFIITVYTRIFVMPFYDPRVQAILSDTQNFIFFKIAVCGITFLLISISIYNEVVKNLNINYLQQLETQIVLSGLPTSEIVSIMVEEIQGTALSYWINELKQNFKDYSSKISSLKSDIEYSWNNIVNYLQDMDDIEETYAKFKEAVSLIRQGINDMQRIVNDAHRLNAVTIVEEKLINLIYSKWINDIYVQVHPLALKIKDIEDKLKIKEEDRLSKQILLELQVLFPSEE